MEEKITIKTRHGELTLEQLAEAQPGIARLMKEIGERFQILYYAAKGGNWRLAQHELNVVISIFRAGATLRPKFAADFSGFVQSHLSPISEMIGGRNWKGFEDAYRKGVDEANKFHEKYGYGFVRYVLPGSRPEYLDLAPHE